MQYTTGFPGLAVIALAAVGWQGEAAATVANGGAAAWVAPAAAMAAAASAVAGDGAGSIQIDGRAWNVVANVQCAVHPGPEVYIAGHAADDASIMIVIEHTPADGVSMVNVGKADGTLVWLAEGDAVTIRVDGQRVSGEGRFTWPLDGAPRTAQGRFEVRCG